ncbi:beta-ketoacyl-ACP synthase [Basilea psittacipulmonis]|uniref:3-oxoacyl-ACP synthase n=1 Tax=Basilea psittacipulmonis DSM 24701 TaxID=1072685 RepID=A0A077DEW0_9BURK|nr:beta-ketoacyl-ACP synthase [Basilea psittacipulmonis]AIL33274.1 3-oxoacyl-ACP synthase [Basilea psittacipulmonis DSM 24701]
MLKRVVVTGMGGITALGKSWKEIQPYFERGENAVIRMDDWDQYKELTTRLAAPLKHYQPPQEWTRKQLRSLGPVSQYCVESAQIALADAGLLDDESIKDGRMGVASGSSAGSPQAICDVALLLIKGDSPNFNANTYVRMMPHTTAANVSIFFGLKGRMIPTSSACTSSSQAIGYAYEAIKYGKIPMMLAGGGEELCASESYVFDALYATSLKNDTPKLTPSPYDKDRDGLVIGEGAGMFVLEEYEHAKARGAKIYAEIVGFGSNCDGTHITRPEADTMHHCMKLALEDAHLDPAAIAYVNGHGTATEFGDIAETQATSRLFGSRMPISSQKSFLGHTLGACGVLEAWFSIEMMNSDWFAPTANLNHVDPRCGELDYLQSGRTIQAEYVMTNNFAFGGVNTSLVFKRMI